jgi:large subunit ribosomal protein L25
MDRKIDVSVPVTLSGVPLGVKNEGGLVEFVHREVLIRVLPTAIPERIDVDISELHLGQHIEASDLRLPEGAELLMPPTETIVTVVGRKVEEEVAPAAPAEGAEAVAAGEGAEAAEDAAAGETKGKGEAKAKGETRGKAEPEPEARPKGREKGREKEK